MLAAVLLACTVVAVDAPTLAISGLDGQVRTLNLADLQKLPIRELKVPDPHSKQTTRYRGVALASVLGLVGAPQGDALRGRSLASSVRVEAADGYVVSFSL